MKKLLAITLSIGLVTAGGISAIASTQTVASSISFHEISAGQFCKTSDKNKVKTAKNGARVKCKLKGGRYRWVNL